LITVVSHEKGKLVPIPRFVQNEKFHATMQRAFERNRSRPMLMLTLAISTLRFVSPKLWLKLIPVLILTKGSKSITKTLTSWLPGHWLTIGIMHFMDPYNFDLDRVENCALHFGIIDNESKPRLIPFCSWNSIHRMSMNGHGEQAEAEAGVGASAGEKAT
jgi:hypothetical protein